MHVQFYICRACHGITDDPAVRRRVEKSEFWGAPLTQISRELVCPDCGAEVIETPTCCDCNTVAAELGDERCGPCVVRLEKEEHEARMAAAKRRKNEGFVDFLKSLLVDRV